MAIDWNTNYWDYKGPKVHAPSPKAKAPKPVPDSERLFTIQRHSLDMLHLLRDLQARLSSHKDPHVEKLLRQIESQAENNYRVINTYLRTNVAPGQGGDVA